MDTIEKIEARNSEFLDEIGKMKPTDPNCSTIVDNVGKLATAEVNLLREENARLNNNAVNDINREKLEIERDKLTVEKWRIGADVVHDVIDTGKCVGFAWIAYNGDKVSYAIRSIFDMAKGFLRSRRH